MRDSQKQRVYDAEKFMCNEGKRLDEMDDLRRYVKAVLNDQRLHSRYPVLEKLAIRFNQDRFEIGDGRRRRAAAGSWRGIWMPRWSRCEAYVLHELSHSIHEYGQYVGGAGQIGQGEPWHGWRFCSIYLDLVCTRMGHDVYLKLRASFKEHRVRYTAPRKWSPAARAAAAARINEIRIRNGINIKEAV